ENVFLNLRTAGNNNNNNNNNNKNNNTSNNNNGTAISRLFPPESHSGPIATTQVFMPDAQDDAGDLSALVSATGATTPPHTDSEDVDVDMDVSMADDAMGNGGSAESNDNSGLDFSADTLAGLGVTNGDSI